MRLSLQKRIRILGYLVVFASVATTANAQSWLGEKGGATYAVAKLEKSTDPDKRIYHAHPAATINAPAVIVIKGKVTAQEDKLALPGVNISVKGTTVGTTTDADGTYSISIPSTESTLVFSFLGYVSQEIKIGNQTTLNVSMIADLKVLNEVVVTALVFKEEKDRMGSTLSTIKPDDIKQSGETGVINERYVFLRRPSTSTVEPITWTAYGRLAPSTGNFWMT